METQNVVRREVGSVFFMSSVGFYPFNKNPHLWGLIIVV
jgi:hypothetical protein